MIRFLTYLLSTILLIFLTPNLTSAQCTSDAGTMELTPVTVCPGESLTLLHNGDHFLDVNDMMQFVLHDNSGPSLGNVFAIYNDPLVAYAMGVLYGETYYVSAIVGDNDGTGNVYLQDTCLSVSPGTPVLFSEPFTLSISAIDVTCEGSADGAATVVNNGGFGPMTYDWSNGASGPTVSNLAAGTYVVTVTDIYGCSQIEVITIISPGFGIICALNISNNLDCNNTTTVVDITCTGGVFPYTYEWSNGGTGASGVIFDPGWYSITITDANGCTAVEDFLIADDTEVPSFTITGNTALDCINGFSILQADIQMGVNLIFEWTYNGSPISDSPIVTTPGAGTYCFTATNVENGCFATECVEVTFDDKDCGTIQGTVVLDENLNCLEDIGEIGLSGWMLSAKGIGSPDFYAMTDSDGNYLMQVLPGDYEVELLAPSNLWQICENDIATTVIDADDVQIVDFMVEPEEECPVMTVDISTWFLRRCFDSKFYVDYCNIGTAEAEDAAIVVEFEDPIQVIDASAPFTDLGNNAYLFELGDVGIGACGDFTITVHVPCSAILGETLCAKAHIFPDEPCGSPDPLWSGASIELSSECTPDSVKFIIENVGAGNMDQEGTFIVIEDGLVYMTGQFKLNSMESQELSFKSNGATWVLDAEQVVGHPGNSMPLLAVEGCGTNGGGAFSTGFVTQFSEDDGDTFISIDCNEVIGSWDPNDKNGFPKGYGEDHLIERGQELDYHIRFQNTGTDTAFNVLIEDVLSPYLDITTLRLGSSSHPFRLEILGSDTLHFIFEDIMLPDSNVNEPASHGFVKFRIAQQANLDLGTTINNEAGIYFDFNDPVITNETEHIIGEDFISNSSHVFIPNVQIKAYPNPFDKETIIKLEGQELGNGVLEIFDLRGKLLRQQHFSGTEIILERKDLNSGLYLYQIKTNEILVGTGKVLVE